MGSKFLAVIFVCLAVVSFGIAEKVYPDPTGWVQNPIAQYEGEPDNDSELQDTQVPIPMKDRVYNRTGIQCVWCSCEVLGRYAEEPKLINLTYDPDCQGYSTPFRTKRKLNQIGVNFIQTTDKSEGRALIRKTVVQERRGAVFGVPGHAMNIVHYDEEKKIVKYINNSDKSLKIRTWTMEEFERRWDGWVLVIYADNDIISLKYISEKNKLFIPIIDRNGAQGVYPKDYILFPNNYN